MNRIQPALTGVLLPSLPRVGLPRELSFDKVALGVGTPDDRGEDRNQGAMALFAFAKRIFGQSASRDLGERADRAHR